MLAQFFDFLNGMEDGRMMLTAEVPADFGQGSAGEFLHEVHGDLARVGDLPGIALHLELSGLQIEALSYGPQN